MPAPPAGAACALFGQSTSRASRLASPAVPHRAMQKQPNDRQTVDSPMAGAHSLYQHAWSQVEQKRLIPHISVHGFV